MFATETYRKYFGIFPRFIELLPIEDGFLYSTEITDYYKFMDFAKLIGLKGEEVLLYKKGDILSLGQKQLKNPQLLKFLRSKKLKDY